MTVPVRLMLRLVLGELIRDRRIAALLLTLVSDWS